MPADAASVYSGDLGFAAWTDVEISINVPAASVSSWSSWYRWSSQPTQAPHTTTTTTTTTTTYEYYSTLA